MTLAQTALDAVTVGRWQFGITTVYHFVLVPLTIGLSLLVIFRETLDPSASFSATLRLGVRLMLFLAAGAVLYYGILLIFLQVQGPGAAVLSGDGCRSSLSLSACPGLPAGHLQAGGGFLLPARFRQHLHLRLDGRAGSGRAGAGRGLLPAVHGAGGAAGGRAGAPWAGWPCWPCSPWASTSARSSAPGPPPPP